MSEERNCQNCKNPFRIEGEDFDFYAKMEVPPPTWCPECRLVRRLAFRNDRSLYRRKCGLCDKDIFSMYSPDATFPVYCKECWYSDQWSALDYGQEYDPSRPFFEQLGELFGRVPRPGVYQNNTTNSPFANGTVESKNIYLSYSVVRSENVMYSKSIDTSSQVVDSIESVGLDQCYENINSERNYRCRFMAMSQNCIDSWFLYDCVNCKNCVLCTNLQNKEFMVRNVQYSKEDYFAELERMNPGSAAALDGLRLEFEKMQAVALYKYADIKKSAYASGNHIMNCKNAKECFETYDSENIKYCYRVLGMKDMHDVCYGGWSESRYEHITAGDHSYNLRFGVANPGNLRNAEYAAFSMTSNNIFGCVGVRNGENMILNKAYGPEEFAELRRKIMAQMEELPYVDPQGRVWKYGEFFPFALSAPFGYNETHAQEVRPLTKEQALSQGFSWKEPEARAYATTKGPEDLPDDIKDVDDGMLAEIIACTHGGTCNHQCTTAFRITPDELQFYRQNGLPLPRSCPNCRHYERLRQMEPLKLWLRTCMCAGEGSANGIWRNSVPHQHGDAPCVNNFKSPYAPERPETVYCEPCYQAEVA